MHSFDTLQPLSAAEPLSVTLKMFIPLAISVAANDEKYMQKKHASQIAIQLFPRGTGCSPPPWPASS